MSCANNSPITTTMFVIPSSLLLLLFLFSYFDQANVLMTASYLNGIAMDSYMESLGDLDMIRILSHNLHVSRFPSVSSTCLCVCHRHNCIIKEFNIFLLILFLQRNMENNLYIRMTAILMWGEEKKTYWTQYPSVCSI